MYIHELDDWPTLRWDRERLADLLAAVRHQQGRVIGHMEALGFQLRQEALLETLTTDVIETSEIEGEKLDAQQVRSSLARRLGMDAGGLRPPDRHVDGIVEMLLDATRHHDAPLSAERIFSWHAALFPTGRSGMTRITVGAWRDDRKGPMQVVSGPVGEERVHFEGPAATRVDGEMSAFLRWFNARDDTDLVLKAAVAHLWFVTIHPFDDGNGRIARAIADMTLARSEKSPQRFYSMSAQIRRERAAYYDVLEQTQKGSTEITPWMEWFLACLGRAIEGAETMLGGVLSKAAFWRHFQGMPLNDRQSFVLNRLLDGLDGKLTTSKYAKLAKCSQDTALRDVQALVESGMLVRGEGGGRSTSYDLPALPNDDRI